MANLKFSGFTAAAAIDQTDSFLVGFDTDGGGANPTNNKWTFSEVAAGLAAVTATPFSIYAADGTIGTTRKALITDTIQFRDSGDTYDILKLHTDGTFALGRGASTTVNNQVAILKSDEVLEYIVEDKKKKLEFERLYSNIKQSTFQRLTKNGNSAAASRCDWIGMSCPRFHSTFLSTRNERSIN